MRILRIAIRNFQGVEASEVSIPSTGVTLIEGPNEVGKSGLAEALDLLLEYTHDSKNRRVEAVRPANRSEGTEVEVELTTGPYHLMYSKRWFHQPETCLQVFAPAPESLNARGVHDRCLTLIWSVHNTGGLLPNSEVKGRLGSKSSPVILERGCRHDGQEGSGVEAVLQFSLDRRVPEGHLLRRIEAVVDLSFVRRLTEPFYSHTGQPSVDPVVLFKMALLGYLYGLPSERRLAEEVELNLAYRWFLGYDLDEATPNHSVLSKARRRFGWAVYQEFFTQIVAQCEQAGLIEGSTVFVDSTLVPARASSKSSRSRALVQQLPGRPEEFVRQLWEENPEELEDPTDAGGAGMGGPVNRFAVSRTDPEAGLVTRPPAAPRFAYKDHCCVDDGAARIVTAVKVTPGYGADEHQLVPLLEAHASQLGRMPKRVAADTKYGTRANYQYCFDRGIAPSIRMAKLHKKEMAYSTDAFRYDPLRDLYWCPTGQPLLRRVEARSSDAVIYRADPASCRVCPVREHCTTSPQGRRILRLRGQEYRDRAKEYLATAQARRDLRRRQVWIEGVFADAKTYRGLNRARGFGLTSMTIQALLVASVQNIQKLAQAHRPEGLAVTSALRPGTTRPLPAQPLFRAPLPA